MKLRFVTSPRGNYHMTELLAGLCAAARDAGLDAGLADSQFPPLEPGLVYVVIPHEHYACEPASSGPSPEQRERTIALCVENPSTPWFETVCELAPRYARLLAINRSSVAAMRARGLEVDHLQLGYTPHWDAWRGADGPRPIDITYLGAADQRRDALLADYGQWFWHRRTSILVPPLAPKPSSRPDYLIDGAKYVHLSHAKLLINLHRGVCTSFEWVRVLQAVANGCVVVSEPSTDHGPMAPGVHFLAAAAPSIPGVVQSLLSNPDRLAEIRTSAYELVRGGLEMSSTVQQLTETAQALASRRSRQEAAPVKPLAADPARGLRASPPPGEDAPLRTAVRHLTTETVELRRAVQRLLERAEGRDPNAEPHVVAQSPAFAEARPRISVAITLHNYEREVIDALESVEASEYVDYELLVLDDASTDGSLAAAGEFLARRPWLPAALLRNPVNRGLGTSRNSLARHARAEMMFVLDADNTIYPSALGRLLEALDADPGATFSYPLLAMRRSGDAIGLLSRYAWDPAGFAAGNYIDAMALLRLDDFWAMGGYTEDPRLTGWEDFHLWCMCADTGRAGRLVPEVLADYRKAAHSMLGWTQSDVTEAWSLMHARFPVIVPATPVG